MFIWTWGVQIWKFGQKKIKFLLDANKRKKWYFKKIHFPSEWKVRQIDCSFDNPTKKFPLEGQNLFAQCLEKIETSIFGQKILHDNVLSDLQIAVLTNTPNKTRQKVKIFRLSVRKWFEEDVFSKENSLKSSHRHLKCSLNNTAELILSRKLEFFRSVSDKDWKTIFFQKSSIIMKNILWTDRMQLQQPAGHNSTKGRRSLAQCAEVVWRIFFSKKFFLFKMFPWTSKVQLGQYCQNYFFQKVRSFSLRVRQGLKNIFLQKNLIIMKKFLWTCRMLFQRPRRKKNAKKGRKVFAQAK